jgi:hypothetical protein
MDWSSDTFSGCRKMWKRLCPIEFCCASFSCGVTRVMRNVGDISKFGLNSVTYALCQRINSLQTWTVRVGCVPFDFMKHEIFIELLLGHCVWHFSITCYIHSIFEWFMTCFLIYIYNIVNSITFSVKNNQNTIVFLHILYFTQKPYFSQ